MLVLSTDDFELIPRPIRNNNPLDIRSNDNNMWKGQVGKDEGNFCIFSNPYWGIRAAVLIMFDYITNHKLRTVSEIVTRWVGGDEKQALPYLDYIRKETPLDLDANIIDIYDIATLLCHMANYEAGFVYTDYTYYMRIVANILTYQED